MDPLNSDEFAAFVGVDWGDQKHDVCLRAAGTEKIESSVLAHKPEAIDEWARRLLQRFAGRPIAVALTKQGSTHLCADEIRHLCAVSH